ncbi:MAG TPA: hypothetical protein VNZ48_22335, partial [Xanthobacteraceae bacterium]|nr:hypothetical protein [Xanthobacteraceae bacterium]
MREGALASRIIAAWGTGFYYLAGEARDIQRCSGGLNVTYLRSASVAPERAFFRTVPSSRHDAAAPKRDRT